MAKRYDESEIQRWANEGNIALVKKTVKRKGGAGGSDVGGGKRPRGQGGKKGKKTRKVTKKPTKPAPPTGPELSNSNRASESGTTKETETNAPELPVYLHDPTHPPPPTH